MGRTEVVVICGGLGPTHDDLTREALAAATGRPLEPRPELIAALEERFLRLGRTMAASNLRQTQVPAGANPIANPIGTAPGIFLEVAGRLIYALPGVPDELTAMLDSFVLPDLLARGGGPPIVTRTLRTAGVAESELAERIAGVVDRLRGRAGAPRLAILSSVGEVRLTLTAPVGTPEVDSVAAELRALLGPDLYGEGDDTLEGVVSAMLRARQLHLAVAESLTGGMLASRLVGIPGASEVLLAGYVAYSPAAKTRDLGVPPETLEAYGLVSTETAIAMAVGARGRAGAEVGLSTTGEAGPDPAEAPVGRICVGLAWEGGSEAWTAHLGGGRGAIRQRTCTWALDRLRRWLLGSETGEP
jgi:nicotinamide-nucleotide amidase